MVAKFGTNSKSNSSYRFNESIMAFVCCASGNCFFLYNISLGDGGDWREGGECPSRPFLEARWASGRFFLLGWVWEAKKQSGSLNFTGCHINLLGVVDENQKNIVPNIFRHTFRYVFWKVKGGLFSSTFWSFANSNFCLLMRIKKNGKFFIMGQYSGKLSYNNWLFGYLSIGSFFTQPQMEIILPSCFCIFVIIAST